MIWWFIGGLLIGGSLGVMLGGLLGRASMRDEIEQRWYDHLRRDR